MLSEPELEFPYEWQLFEILSAGRQSSGFGVSPIPVTEFLSVCELYEIRDRLALWEIIRRLDMKFLSEISKRKKD